MVTGCVIMGDREVSCGSDSKRTARALRVTEGGP